MNDAGTRSHDGVRHGLPRRAFTLLELMIVISIIAVVTTLVIPQLTSDDQVRLVAASSLVRSDLEMAQVMTISHPAEPVVMRFDPANDQYWLALAATPDTPIVRPDTGESYLVHFGSGRASAAEAISVAVSDLAANTIEFDAQGGVVPFTSTPVIKLMTEGRWLKLHVDTSTGSVTETSGGG